VLASGYFARGDEGLRATLLRSRPMRCPLHVPCTSDPTGSMIYSSACEYAIRAATHLARRYQDSAEMIKLRDIAEAEGLPSPFLSTILTRLVDAGILGSARGPTGGYFLQRPPSEISLFEIRAAMDGEADLESCAVGLAVCSDTSPCPLHETWKPIREGIREYLESTSLESMAAAVERKQPDRSEPDTSATLLPVREEGRAEGAGGAS